MNIEVYEIVQYEYADSLSRLARRLITCKLGCPLVIRYMRELTLTLIRHDGMRPLTSQSGNRSLHSHSSCDLGVYKTQICLCACDYQQLFSV